MADWQPEQEEVLGPETIFIFTFLIFKKWLLNLVKQLSLNWPYMYLLSVLVLNARICRLHNNKITCSNMTLLAGIVLLFF